MKRTTRNIALPLTPPYKAAMTSIRPWRDIARRKSRQIMVGNIPVGGDAPISVQTMTNTLTSDAKATTGNFFIDDELLARHGITDLERYSVTPGTTDFVLDFFVD